MAERIVQLLVTCAVETERTRADFRNDVAEALTIVADAVSVELVESRAPRRRGGTPPAGEGDPDA